MALHARFQQAFTLREEILADLQFSFAQFGHHPSPELWVGISDVVSRLVLMADGKCLPRPYLSRLDPGVGKTQTAVHFIRNLLKSPDHRDVAVLYCVSRLDEIPSLAADLGKENVGVFTRDDEKNKLGSDPYWARVLITTQQMVDSRLSDGKSFGELKCFHYTGKPRQVKIWDESMMPAEELTLDPFRLGAMPEFLCNLSLPLAEKIQAVTEEVRRLKPGSTYAFFDPSEFVEYDKAKAVLANLKENRFRETGETIWKLAGKTVRVRYELKSGNTLLDYRNHLPDDFFPVLILDASGRVRETYKLWEEHRKGLVMLRAAAKNYSNLTVHVWSKGGGKKTWRENSASLIEGIIRTINKKPDQKWLIVTHKEDDWLDKGQERIPNLESAIRDQVNIPGNLYFLTWGNAHATNDFVECTNVILAGTLFYPGSVYEVRARASMGLPAAEELGEKTLTKLVQWEHKHLILQAACRGSVRKCEGDHCMPMNLYLIANNKTGIPSLLGDIFPACKVEEWFPTGRPPWQEARPRPYDPGCSP
jgi:hypothetical protein